MSLTDTLRLRVVKEQELTVTTAGTPVVIPAYKYGEAVRIINNNHAGVLVAVGRQATVDANSAPPIGLCLSKYDSHIEYGKRDDLTSLYDEIYVDANTNGTKVTVQYLGR